MKILFLVLKIVILASIICLASCEKPNPTNCDDYDFSDCLLEEPDWEFIYIKVTINDLNPYVPIVIYRGNIESNDIEWVDTAWSSDYSIDVPLDKYYSVSAEYKLSTYKVLAIDGNEVKKVKTNVCDEVCWYIRGKDFDVELKY